MNLFWALLGPALLLGSLSPWGRGVRRWVMARVYDRALARFEAWAAPRKERLFEGVRGTVVEIGPGTGANLRFLPPAVERWIGLEPNRHMHAALRASLERRGVPGEVRAQGAERSGLPTASADAVVSTLVLCSVADPAAVLREIHRVLKPGGRLLLIEHVAAPAGTRLFRFQRWIRPIWAFLADGCHPDRDTARLLARAGFGEVCLERLSAPRRVLPRVVSPLILGTATRD